MKSLKTPAIIGSILILTAALLLVAGFNSKQVISTVIFLMIICGTLFYWKFRLAFAFVGIAVLLGTKLLDVPHVIEFAGLDIILFLVGMMTIIGFRAMHFTPVTPTYRILRYGGVSKDNARVCRTISF